MRLPRRRVVWLALPAAVAVALAGCSDPTPAGRVKRSTASPTTSSPSPSPTKLTAEQEVEAAVRAYYKELTRAIQTNDTSELESMVAETCPCYGTVAALDKARQQGHTTRGVRLKLTSLNVHDVIRNSAAAEVTYHASSYEVLKPGGSVVSRVPERNDHLDLSLTKINSRWIVTNVFDMGHP